MGQAYPELDWDYLKKELGNITADEMRSIRLWANVGSTTEEIVDEILAEREDMGTGGAAYGMPEYDTVQQAPPEEKVWDSGLRIIEPCSLAAHPVIYIPAAVWRQIVAMTDRTKTEWLGYLDYTAANGRISVTGLSIPKQMATPSEVEPVEPQVGKGVIHAHPGGGKPAFSGTDRETLNPNNEFSIVISRDLQMTAVAKGHLPCGALSLVDATVEVEGMDPDNDFYELNKDKIGEEPAYSTAGYGKWP